MTNVLLLLSDDEPVADLEAHLADAGCTVRRCVEPGAPSFPCQVLLDGRCPLDDGLVDVALDVRVHPWPYPTSREHGVQCALRQRIPLVVAGATRRHPFEQWAAVTVTGTAGVAEACAEAIDVRLVAVREAVQLAVTNVLDVDDGVDVTTWRHDGTLHVRVTADVPGVLRSAVAARAGVAARRADSQASAIELELAASAGDNLQG